MKLFLLPLLLFSPLAALPLGNPADPSFYYNGDNFCCHPFDPGFSWCNAWNFRIGFYGDYVFDRHMERNSGGGDIDDFEIYTNAAYLVLNICKTIDIFATLGATSINLASNPNVFGNTTANARLFLETETDFSWSVGGRLTIWECNCWYFGIEGQYFYTKPDVDLVEVAGNILASPDDDIDVKYTEWQVGVGVAYMIQIGCTGISAVPYAGFKWSGSCANFNDGFIPSSFIEGPSTTLFDLENNKFWGWALGTTLLLNEGWSLTVEGRWADEKAIYANGQLCF